MRGSKLVTAVTAAAVLTASLPAPALAQRGQPLAAPTTLRASIERAAEQLSAPAPVRRTTPVRRQMQGMGGGGGGGMMLMTLIVTAASLAGTYFLVKEMRKTTNEAAGSQ